MKKITIILLIFIIINTTSYSANKKEIENPVKKVESALVIDFETSKVLLENNSFKSHKIGGLSKLMIFLVAIDEVRLNKQFVLTDEITITESDISSEKKSILKEGKSYTLNDLLKLMIIKDDDVAANAISKHFSPSQDIFVKKMNSKAKQLNLINTNFININGNEQNKNYNYSCTYDIYLILKDIIKKYPNILNINTTSKENKLSNIMNTSIDKKNMNNISSYIVFNKNQNYPFRIISILLYDDNKKTQENIYQYINKNITTKKLKYHCGFPTKTKENKKNKLYINIIYSLFS